MRTRLIASFALIIIVTLAAVSYFARQGALEEVNSFVRRGGLAGLEGLVTSLESHYEQSNTWDGADAVLAEYGGILGGQRGPGGGKHSPGTDMGTGMGEEKSMSSAIVLSDSDGNPIAASGEFDPKQPYTEGELNSGIPMTVDGEIIGYLISEAFMGVPAGNYESELGGRLSQAALNAALVAGGIAVILASLLAYYSFQPVRHLTQAAAMLARGDMGKRVDVRGGGELAALGSTFNTMAAALEDAAKKRKAMTADIAHELRNPLAVQLANLEALEDGLYPLTADNLSPITDQNRLLTRLVEDLHTLALSDAKNLSLHKRPTDVHDLLIKTIAAHQTHAEARNVSLDMEDDLTGCPSLAIDPDRMGQIVGNLILNALRYAPEGGWVRVLSACEEGSFSINVLDNGPGIGDGDLERIFERFYRGDPSRSRNEGGSGLGLTIARRLVEAHGGTLTAANHHEGGAVFSLNLPLNDTAGD